MRKSRDCRIDFMRGVALLIIFSDHVKDNPVSVVTPLSLCYWDMSEVFVFLSGYVAGLAYYPIFQSSRGALICTLRVMRRWGQVYAAHVATLLCHLAISHLVVRYALYVNNAELSSVYAFYQTPMAFIERVFFLNQHVAYFDILPIYLVFLPLIPIALFLRWLHPALLLFSSSGVYVATQMFELHQYLTPHWPWSYQPLAWQFLFFSAFACATSERIRQAIPLENKWVVLIAFVVFELLLLCKIAGSVHVPFAYRPLLGPTRIVHFASAFILFRKMLFARFLPGNHASARPVILCGRNSLMTYCCGCIMANLLNIMPHPEGGLLIWAVTVNCIGWLSCIVAAKLSASLKAFVSSLPASAAPRPE